jgi:hypothetical protein
MKRLHWLGLFALATGAVAAVPGQACWLKTTVPVLLAPAAQAEPPRIPLGTPVPLELPAPLVPVPAPTPVIKPIAHPDFAAAFKPAAGTYEVLFVHPGSKCAVPVCFTLPPGCPQVKVYKRELVFDYGKHEVEIRFKLFGKVAVTYR